MNEREIKKQKFTQPSKNHTLLFSIVGILTVIIMIGTYMVVAKSNTPDSTLKGAANIGEKVAYSSAVKLQQTNVENSSKDGKVIITTLSTLKDKKFIRTEYQSNETRIPLTAFVQPDGNVMAAVSYCEPCRGETFHITGSQIICNVCGTVWDLQTLKGLSGGCQAYPPEALTYSLNGDNLEIPQTTLDTWKPRV
ncbi:DUF2318 domain-containing protein [Desulfosporosinus orientis]|nr:DUF2318 domain-containing protein [Desulfosporosinus orientis]